MASNWGSTNTTSDYTWSNYAQYDTTSYTSFGNMTNRWFRRLTGPTYSVRTATLILVQTKEHRPEKLANIGGIQFKRTTRIGKRHYYKAVA